MIQSLNNLWTEDKRCNDRIQSCYICELVDLEKKPSILIIDCVSVIF